MQRRFPVLVYILFNTLSSGVYQIKVITRCRYISESTPLLLSAVREATQIDSAALFNPDVSVFSLSNSIDVPPQLNLTKKERTNLTG